MDDHAAATPGSGSFYNVGGVRLARPFKIRRLGHFGINVQDPEASRQFYEHQLGLRVSDPIDMKHVLPKDLPADQRARLGSSVGYFLRHGSDHHAFVLFPRRVMDAGRPAPKGGEQVTTNQITWQVGTLREVSDAMDYFKSKDVDIRRSGRDVPGSNWHLYPVDADFHINELYYGIEQIGWDGYSKPASMHAARYTEPPPLPHESEHLEVSAGYGKGVGPQKGYRHEDPRPERFDVGGVLLARPFKIVRVGPVRLFVKDIDKATRFYRDVMGLAVTEEVVWKGRRCVFLRTGAEHHSIALYPVALRAELGLNAGSTLFSFGFQLGSYQQLRDAVPMLKAEGVTIRHLPPELFPGIDHNAFAIDPDGNAMQLYCGMDQVGWDGRPRPRAEPAPMAFEDWPETVEERPGTFGGEVYMGPLG